MKSTDIRRLYIDFFVSQNHKLIPSSTLVPENDPTTLFTSAGMQPLISYILGETHPLGSRLVNSQRCFRSQDISEVGDNRHDTFFEMLGNWSLGDYFKKEQLSWFFEFLVSILKLDPGKLYVTVFGGFKEITKDEESIKIWKNLFQKAGINAKENERIFVYDVSKNWWSRSGIPDKMPQGEPGGPSSEVFYDLGNPHNKSFGEKCHPNCSCGRFIEIGNSVFMEYQKNKKGGFDKLKQKNVDFGGGLERLAMAVNNESDIFNIDLFNPLIKILESSSGQSYKEKHHQKAMRIISDHYKASLFMIADGVIPGNKMQGYFLRRLIRRSLVYAKEINLNFTRELISNLTISVINIYKDYYGYLTDKEKEINSVILDESLKFGKTLDKGLKEIEKTESLDGNIAFKLYETYGFPWEMTEEIARKRGEKINREQFETEFNKHRELSRNASSGMFKGGLADTSEETKKLHTATHLLHSALRQVLGNHVSQKGSHITNERLRFDFTHIKKLTSEELQKVQDFVNLQIQKNLIIDCKIMSLNDALKEGALAFFKDKYQDKVKVYTISLPSGGWFSKEICGGPHVNFTSSLGKFKIIKEESVAAGTRRIYAVLN